MRTRSAVKNDAKWLLAALVTLLSAAPLTAHADPGGSVELPFDPAAMNPCNGEFVTMSGMAHEVNHVALDGAGGMHLLQNLNMQDVGGEGSLGNSYRFPNSMSMGANGNVGSELTMTYSAAIISSGNAPNFHAHMVVHTTVNADGTVTSSFSDISYTCN